MCFVLFPTLKHFLGICYLKTLLTDEVTVDAFNAKSLNETFNNTR